MPDPSPWRSAHNRGQRIRLFRAAASHPCAAFADLRTGVQRSWYGTILSEALRRLRTEFIVVTWLLLGEAPVGIW